MDPITIGALISGGIGLVGGLFDNKERSDGQAAANAMNLQLAREQQNWNLEQWNRQNEYNLPSAQMQRIKEAGLNPALFYGNGTQSNTAQDVAGYTRPQVENVKRGFDAFSNVASMASTGAQMAITEAHRKNVEEDTLNKALQGAGIASDNVKKAEDAKIAPEMAKYNLAQAQQNVSKVRNDIALTQQNTSLARQNVRGKRLENDYKEQTFESKVGQEEQRLDKMKLENTLASKTMQIRVQQEIARLENMRRDGTIKDAVAYEKQLNNSLKELGLSEKDHAIVKLLVRQGLGDRIAEVLSSIFK